MDHARRRRPCCHATPSDTQTAFGSHPDAVLDPRGGTAHDTRKDASEPRFAAQRIVT